uniref:Uncharacterized protein n=1 Tax=Faecalibaculum rodentium TaxID=1702221 RepID=A0A140DTZ9_9FIRM|nr:hypothetical protein AALO17_09920 [Faecalibaculum rodentium]
MGGIYHYLVLKTRHRHIVQQMNDRHTGSRFPLKVRDLRQGTLPVFCGNAFVNGILFFSVRRWAIVSQTH